MDVNDAGLAEVFSACSRVQVHSGNVHANTKIPNLSTAKDVSGEDLS